MQWRLVACVGLAACGALSPGERRPTYALSSTGDTALGQLLAERIAEHPGESGVAVLNTGRESLVARLALCDAAERSIDVQTFIWSGDTAGRVVWDALRRAADRGVRVRIVVDDMELGGRDIDALQYPNIEVRIINPFVARKSGRTLELVGRLTQLNHRMHNKLFIVDNQAAFVGGRNLADGYFGLGRSYNFRDLDVLVVGTAVAQTSRAFDDYWNSPKAYPNRALGNASAEKRAQLMRQLAARVDESLRAYPYPRIGVRELFDDLCWGTARVVWDDPARLSGRGQRGGPSEAVAELARAAQREVVVENAYFVPDRSLTLVSDLARRQVALRVLTNSLASTDLVPVHAHYATVRKPMLELGAQLYELRPDADLRRRYVASGNGRLGLHAKAAVFDRRTVVVGSFNLDPRSRSLNTEVVLIADNPCLGRRILAAMVPDFQPENSWTLFLGPEGGVVWRERTKGIEHDTGFQPGGAWRHIKDVLLVLLPVRGLL
jgi:putative cardiolipin synthase